MTREEFSRLRVGDFVCGPRPCTVPRRIVSASFAGEVQKGWKSKRIAVGGTRAITLAIRRLSWTRRPSTTYIIGDAAQFTLARRPSQRPAVVRVGPNVSILAGEPRAVRGVWQDEGAAISDELALYADLSARCDWLKPK